MKAGLGDGNPMQGLSNAYGGNLPPRLQAKFDEMQPEDQSNPMQGLMGMYGGNLPPRLQEMYAEHQPEQPVQDQFAGLQGMYGGQLPPRLEQMRMDWLAEQEEVEPEMDPQARLKSILGGR